MTEPAAVHFDLRLSDLSLDFGGRVAPLVVRGWMWAADGPEFLRQRGLPVVEVAPGVVVRASTPAHAAPAPSSAMAATSARTAASAPPSLVSQAPASFSGASSGATSSARSNLPTVLIVHALTGHATAGGPSGWWSPAIGPGRALDPNRHRILCFNNLGSCYGTTGPADPGFPDATVTTWDQARMILRALDALGIERVALVTGGSLGGMVTFALAALAPSRVERIAPIAGCMAASAWIIGFNHVQRRAIALDPDGEGLALARQIAMLTYRAEPGLDARQGRREAPSVSGGPASSAGPPVYRMQTYLDYQGRKLVDRFERSTYLAMMDAMDHHDISRPPRCRDESERWNWDDEAPGVARIRASCLAVGIDTDQLFFPVHSVAAAEALAARGVRAESVMIRSIHGHDAFLIEWDQLDTILRRALELPAGSHS